MENVTASTSVHSSEIIALEQPRDGLSDYSPNDVRGTFTEGQSDDVGGIYASALEFERYAARNVRLWGLLLFGWVLNPETSVNALRLRTAYFFAGYVIARCVSGGARSCGRLGFTNLSLRSF